MLLLVPGRKSSSSPVAQLHPVAPLKMRCQRRRRAAAAVDAAAASEGDGTPVAASGFGDERLRQQGREARCIIDKVETGIAVIFSLSLSRATEDR